MRKIIVTSALLAAVAIAGAMPRGEHESATVKRSPTPPWIEVYHDGELSAEWQPSAGAIYRVLGKLLDDELEPAPLARVPMMLAKRDIS